MEEMNREEVIEELEQKASEETQGLSITMDEDVYRAATTGGFDLKSAAIATGATILIGGVVKYGPKAVRWIKGHLPMSKKAKKDLEDEVDKEFNTEDAEDADYRDADDEDEEPAKK